MSVQIIRPTSSGFNHSKPETTSNSDQERRVQKIAKSTFSKQPEVQSQQLVSSSESSSNKRKVLLELDRKTLEEDDLMDLEILVVTKFVTKISEEYFGDFFRKVPNLKILNTNAVVADFLADHFQRGDLPSFRLLGYIACPAPKRFGACFLSQIHELFPNLRIMQIEIEMQFSNNQENANKKSLEHFFENCKSLFPKLEKIKIRPYLLNDEDPFCVHKVLQKTKFTIDGFSEAGNSDQYRIFVRNKGSSLRSSL